MARAIRIHENGGPEVLQLEDVDVPAPAADEVQIQHTAIGVNFIDVYDRTGLYPLDAPEHARPRSGRQGRRERPQGA